MLPTGNIVEGNELVSLSKAEKAELKRLRASGPKARLVHLRYGDPAPYRMDPTRECAEIRISYEGAPPKKGAAPKAVAVARAIVAFRPRDDSSNHVVNGPPIGVKDLLNDMIRCGERVADDTLPYVKRCESAMRFVDIGDQLERLGGQQLAYNCYHATATQPTLDAIDAVLREAATTPPAVPARVAPKEASPPRMRPPRPKRPPKPVVSTTPTPEALEARRQREAKHAQHEADRRAAEKAAEEAHKKAMAERRAARAAEKAAASAR